jgi:hypothetical protein
MSGKSFVGLPLSMLLIMQNKEKIDLKNKTNNVCI